ncbi:unnamed protein product [Symbiodinium natans]|uniref:Uncharacterized protein n=1 Tax=Symbiodinium natans TaxID=878477 RepID=A0A812SEG7_9DINO|nr:unnamed protein product [Symbiodinium natans]
MACHVCHTRAAVDGGACDCCEAVRRLQRMVHSPALPPWPPQQLCCSGSRPRWPSLLNEPPRRTDSREPSRERSRSPRHSPEPPSRRREDGPEPEHRGHETKPWPLCWRPRALPIRAEAPARAPARGKAAAAGDEPWRLTRPSAAGRGGTPTCPWASVRVGEASRPGPPDETTQVGRQRERASRWAGNTGVRPACLAPTQQVHGKVGPPTTHGQGTLSSYDVPLLLHAAGLLEDEAARAWESLPWFRASRAALGNRPRVPLQELEEAVAQQARAGAGATDAEAFRRPRSAAPSAGVPLQVAVAALASPDYYLPASAQEALLVCYAGEGGAAAIAHGAAAFPRPVGVTDNGGLAGRDVDALIAGVGGGARTGKTRSGRPREGTAE